jgi:methylase of polypeptide subunit release factors
VNSTLASLCEQYECNRRPLPVTFRQLLPALNSRDRYTHLIHPYPAKLIPHIPAFFLAQLFKHPVSILDPFCGSGTVLLEAYLAGHRVYGADINPLARLLTTAKLTPLALRDINRSCTVLISRLASTNYVPVLERVTRGFPNLDHWFSERVAENLAKIVSAIDGCRSAALQRFFQICLSATARRLSYADPRLSVPVRIRADKHPRNHPLTKATRERLKWLEDADPTEVFLDVVNQNAVRVEALRVATQAHSSNHEPTISQSMQHLEHGLSRASIDIAITSPPYLGAQKYIRSSSLGLMWLLQGSAADLKTLNQASVGREHLTVSEISDIADVDTNDSELNAKIKTTEARSPLRAAIVKDYFLKMEIIAEQIRRSLKPRGTLVIVMGRNHVAGSLFDTDYYLERLLGRHGFRVCLKLVDKIPSRGLMTRRNRAAHIIPAEIVTWYQKEN